MFDSMYIITKYFPFNNGDAPAESFLENEIWTLSKKAKKITIFASDARKGSKNTVKLADNVCAYACSDNKIIRNICIVANMLKAYMKKQPEIAEEIKSKSIIKKIYLLYFAGKSDYYLKRIKRIMKKKRISKTDNCVIYNFWFYTYARTAVYLSQECSYKTKIFSRAHGYDLYEDRNRICYLPLRKYLMEKFDYVFPCSENGRQYLLQKYSDYRHKLFVSYLGSPDYGKRNVNADDVFSIVSCSRVESVKRVELMLEALKLFLQNHKDIRVKWTHIGGGTLFKDLKIKAKELIKSGNVVLLGNMSNRDVLDFYKNSNVDLFVNVSESEGLPISIMEAASFGIPVLATDVGGTKEIIDNKNGWLIEKDITAYELSEKLHSIYSMPNEKLVNKGDAARCKWEENFQISNNTEKLLLKLEEEIC